MALHQLPAIEATITVVHTGSTTGTSFTSTLDASDGAPMAPQQVYTFDLSVFAPDLIGLSPQVDVFRAVTGERVGADVDVDNALITITFFEAVTPTDYRVKVMG